MIRYRSEFTSFRGVDWRLDIDDTEWPLPTFAEFCVNSKGFVLSYEGDEKDLFNPVISSNVSFGMLITSGILAGFIDLLVNSPEERFRLAIYRNNQLYWVGIILQDAVKEELIDFPYEFEVRAVDGLSRLSRKEYIFTDTERETFTQHLSRLLQETQTQNLWTGDYLKMAINWYENNLSTANTNVWEELTFLKSVFTKTDSNGNTTADTYFEVLQKMCCVFGARIFQSNGQYHIVQAANYDESTITEWTYDTSISTPTNTNTNRSYDLLVDQITRYKEYLMQLRWLPALLRAEVIYNHFTDNDNALGFVWSNVSTPVEQEISEVAFNPTGETKINLTAKVEHRTNVSQNFISANGFPVHRYRFALTLRVGSYRLERRTREANIFNILYERVVWTTSAQTYDFWSEVVTEYDESNNVYLSFQVETPRLFFNGKVYVKFELIEIEDSLGNDLSDTFYISDIQHSWKVSDLFFNVVDAGETDTVPADDARRYVLDGNASNSFIKKKETYLGDGPQDNSSSALKIGSDNTGSWKIGTTGTESAKIQELLVTEMLALQEKPTKLIFGKIIASDIHFENTIQVDADIFMFMRASYEANSDTWSGVWAKVAKGQVDPDDTIETIEPVSKNKIDADTGEDNDNRTGVRVIERDLWRDLRDIRLIDAISIGTINQNLIGGNAVTEISINPIEGRSMNAGDKITLIRPDTGETEVITLSDDYDPNDPSISVDHTFVNNFPAETYILPDFQAATEKARVERVKTISGNRYTIEDFELPDPATNDQKEINRRLRVERGGVRIYYGVHFSIDVSGANNDIIATQFDFQNELMYAELIR